MFVVATFAKSTPIFSWVELIFFYHNNKNFIILSNLIIPLTTHHARKYINKLKN
jgi:hypothetical protein